MDLIKHYNSLYEASSKEILAGNYFIDDQIDSSSDNRFGITLLIRPNDQIKRNIQDFLDEVKAADPLQYYYPGSDIHITVMSIISCYSGFNLANISVEDYVLTIEKSLAGINDFDISLSGVTASTSGLMIQGFPHGSTLHHLRNNLRHNFKKSGLEESIDRRYAIFTAHSTVMRFREKIRDSVRLIRTVDKYRDHCFGKFSVKNLELVYNDWYQREKFVRQLHRFNLK